MVVFSRVDVAAHKTLAEQMAEWEKKNAVKVYPIGATADFQTINAKAEAIKRGGQNGANTTKLTAKLKRDANERN
jgi:hypothetical protein